jgi:hypothetical protein
VKEAADAAVEVDKVRVDKSTGKLSTNGRHHGPEESLLLLLLLLLLCWPSSDAVLALLVSADDSAVEDTDAARSVDGRFVDKTGCLSACVNVITLALILLLLLPALVRPACVLANVPAAKTNAGRWAVTAAEFNSASANGRCCRQYTR